LRHTGNQFAADAGANLRKLMTRMGHASAAAALTYLHSWSVRQAAIADEVGTMARQALNRPNNSAQGNGMRRARTADQGAKPSVPSATRMRDLVS